MSMKTLLLFLSILFILSPVHGAIYPRDPDIGQTGEGEPIVQAFREEFSPEWVESYVEEKYWSDFTSLHGPTLPSILPLEDFIVSETEGRHFHVKTMDGSFVATVFLTPDGLIESLSIEKQ